MLNKKKVLLGVTGSIAAYKAVDIARRLKEEGADVHVVMTGAACRFIPPYTLEAMTGNPVHTELFNDSFQHINLPKESDLFMVTPVTANTINKFACGIADDLLSNIWLTYEGPVIMAPAMNHRMYRNPIVQKNIKELKKLNVQFVGPATGSLACGEEGAGRLAEVSEIVEAVITSLTPKDFKGQNVLVTAGPTIEPIDPVRFISNRSSGKMGYAVAKAAARRGANVTLVSGPSLQKASDNISFITVETASEMEKAVFKYLPKATTVIMAAAVSDFSPSINAKVKLEKSTITDLKLKKNSDIAAKVGKKKGKRVLVGFAAETGNNVERAKDKLNNKNLDLIVMNNVMLKGAGFDVDTNIVTIIDKKGYITEHPIMKKIDVANMILDKIHETQRKI